jgi:hypothetical protein
MMVHFDRRAVGLDLSEKVGSIMSGLPLEWLIGLFDRMP